MSSLYALLIGVDHYFEYPLPGNILYPKLGGCVRDINKVYNFLTSRLGMDPGNIIKLTASLGIDKPAEPEHEWPTYTNLVAAFKAITARVQSGDQVYIQYSGHGGRTATMFPELKGQTAFDEGLVPPDIGKPGDPYARYLRDVELHHLINALKSREVRLTVIFDCCHSGGATRGMASARKRGIGSPDMSPPPQDSRVAGVAALTQSWGAGSGKTRGVNSQTSWLFETTGYTLFAACRANESAYEDAFDGQESNGALTYWLLDTLANGGPNLTWKMVADRVAAKVHSQFAEQTPTLQGEGDFKVFGSDRIKSHYAVPVLKVEENGQWVQLQAGEAQGVKPGVQFAVYPVGGTDFNDPSNRLGLVEIEEVEAVHAWARVLQPEQSKPIEEGAQAVLLSVSDVTLLRGVAVVVKDDTQRQAIEAAIESMGKGFIALASGDLKTAFQVAVNPEHPGEYELWDAAGASIPNLRPAIKVTDPDAPGKLVQRLVHLTKYQNVQALDMPDAALQEKLKVELEAKPVNRPGDRVKLVITNQQSPAGGDDHILNITVLALSSDWSIAQIFPAGASFEPLDPGQSIPLEFEAYLPEDRTESTDILKVFATRATTQFRWLELPALDQPEKPRRMTRSGISDPLERMLALVTDPTANTRSLKLVNSAPDKGWIVAQKTLVVKDEDENEHESSSPP